METWLLDRLFKTKGSDQPTPRFAYQSTVNWMEALAILCRSESFSHEKLKDFYQSVRRRTVNMEADTLAYENLVMAWHNVAALNEMRKDGNDHVAMVRSAIIAWYYTVYYASSAMIATASGSSQEEHRATMKVWHEDIVKKKLAIAPFDLYLDTLVEKDVKSTMATLKNGNGFKLRDVPKSENDAWGCVYEYLSGTALNYEKWRVEKQIKDRTDFKKLKVNNFHTQKAQKLRDEKLKKCKVNFLTQAFRYRGKANYRDSIYLSYGEDRDEGVMVLIKNLDSVATTYVKMACHYIARRVEKGTWGRFSEDLQQNLTIKIDQAILGE